MSDYAVGVDLGGTNLKAALVDRDDGIIANMSVATESERGPEHVIDRIADLVRALSDQTPKDHVAGIGIGAPGAVNWERTTVARSPNFSDWDVVNVEDALLQRLNVDVPIIVENDANAAGLGSAFFGAGQPFDSFIMITLGTGVGGAIIYQNKIFRGATGGAAEIGHMTIDYEGPRPRSGVAGAIEGYLGQHFLSRHARYMLLNREESRVHTMANEELSDITPKMLYDAAVSGDEAAREVLAWAGHKLGCVIGSAINLLDIRKIVVGGGVSNAGDLILDPARETVVRYVMPGLQEGVQILQETLGNEAGMLGAAQLVYEFLDASNSSHNGS